ncbi:hypothetical protein BD779DRAFT_1439908 [Infundibulicybe gibba]|nr:hypothetical protein BD779DRAFT_1439908 [Infundibulicybe gibba]
MAGHGATSPGTSSNTPSRSASPNKKRTSQALSDLRISLDSERSTHTSPPPVQHSNGVNGHTSDGVADEPGSDLAVRLQHELDKTLEEKRVLETQYHNLLAKLTTMRTTLGNKLKQDAEELDRQEQLVHQLTVQNEDLSATVDTLKTELIDSHREAERASTELDTMRSRAYQESAQENFARERELRETQTELERCRMERDEWERAAMQERAIAEETKSAVDSFKRELDSEREAREQEALELDREREKSSNLQAVLQDFQSGKDHELRQAVKDYESRLDQVTQSLAEYKHRAITAEMKLEEIQANTSVTADLTKEIKEKNLLIGKLRHEAVILNEHLIEALRRLRRSSSDTNVDRRLVTNVLLSFLTTPRADAKRFEMLSLLATVLSWTDPEREKAGLQRAQPAPAPAGSGFWGRSTSIGGSPQAKGQELQKTDETESFSRLWVEFLLTEAAAGEGRPPPTPTSPGQNNSLPGTPTLASPTKGLPPRRLSSFNMSAMASSPNLTLGPPPSRKGKEREKD